MRPDFSKIDFKPAIASNGAASRAKSGSRPSTLRSRVSIRRRSGGARTSGICRGHSALSARALQHHVRDAAVDDPAICGLLHGRRVECVLSPQPGRRTEGALGRIRSGHASRLRLRSRARDRRRGQGRRGHRLDSRHEDSVRPDSARSDVGVDDHERRGAADHGVLHCRRRRAGRDAGEAERDHSERHSQRVHGPQHLHLSARGIDADHRRYLPLLRGEDAEVQLHQRERISHAGGGRDGRYRTGVHAGRRPGVSAHRREGGPRRR